MVVVGLLRGINVGTSVKVPMPDLKRLVEAAQGTDVATYLNSGNVIFNSQVALPQLRQRLERDLETTFGQPIRILLLSGATIQAIRQAIPEDWQNDAAEQTCVAYLFPGLDPSSLIAELPVKHHLITFKTAPSAILWNIQRPNYNTSQITKIASHPAYKSLTIRNVNTARKLAELCAAREL